MKCDLPEPKKPETQTPIRDESTGSLGLSAAARNASKNLRKYSVNCLVTTYSSSSCQMLSASRWSALMTPLIGRSIDLMNSFLIFIVWIPG